MSNENRKFGNQPGDFVQTEIGVGTLGPDGFGDLRVNYPNTKTVEATTSEQPIKQAVVDQKIK